jgi:hypothetical protein
MYPSNVHQVEVTPKLFGYHLHISTFVSLKKLRYRFDIVKIANAFLFFNVHVRIQV